MPENGWPPDFPALRRGEGCTMCGPGVDDEYRPVKTNWFTLGNGLPDLHVDLHLHLHLHLHVDLHLRLVPRPLDDARPGWPVESEAFDFASDPAVDALGPAPAAAALRARLRD